LSSRTGLPRDVRRRRTSRAQDTAKDPLSPALSNQQTIRQAGG